MPANVQSVRGFCIGKKNWEMIDTVNGATSSAIIYSIVETAKANGLKPFNYFEYLLTEIPKHADDKNTDFFTDLLPWSLTLPENIRKPKKADINDTVAKRGLIFVKVLGFHRLC